MAKKVVLKGELQWDNSRLRRGLKESEGMIATSSRNIAGIGRAALAAASGIGITVGLRETARHFDRIDKLSRRFSLPVETLQKFGFAAEQSGADMEILAKGMNMLTRNGEEAERGVKTFSRAFEVLEIDVAKFNRLAPDEKFLALADAVQKAKNEQKAHAAVMQIMGNNLGSELLPLLKEGSEGLQSMADSVNALGDKGVKAVARLNDEFNRLKTNILPVIGNQIAGLVEALEFVGLIKPEQSRPTGGRMMSREMRAAIGTRAFMESAPRPGGGMAPMTALMATRIAVASTQRAELATRIAEERRAMRSGAMNPLMGIGMQANMAMARMGPTRIGAAGFSGLDANIALQGNMFERMARTGSFGADDPLMRTLTANESALIPKKVDLSREERDRQKSQGFQERMVDSLNEIERSMKALVDETS